MAVSDLADWWDEQRKVSDRQLELWMTENPQWWMLGLATFTATTMEMGAGMVDVLRFGQGAAAGGWRGYGSDALRLLVLLGPLARVAGFASRLAHTQMIRLAVKPAGMSGPCTFQAVNNALAVSKGRPANLILTVKEAAKVKLVDPAALTRLKSGTVKLGAWIEELYPYLKTIGIKIKDLGPITRLEDVVNAARTQNGVVIFAIRWKDMSGNLHLHSMMAVKTVKGVQFADYGGKFISSLSELAKRGGTWIPSAEGFQIAMPNAKKVAEGVKGSAALVESMQFTAKLEQFGQNAWVRGMSLLMGAQLVETIEDGIDIGVQVEPVAALDSEETDPELVKRSFEAFKSRMAGKKLIRLDPVEIKGNRKGPPPPQYLTGVQYRLNALGFGAGPIDGIMGPKTKAAVLAFQNLYELKPDGMPGPKTQGRLVEFCGF